MQLVSANQMTVETICRHGGVMLVTVSSPSHASHSIEHVAMRLNPGMSFADMFTDGPVLLSCLLQSNCV